MGEKENTKFIGFRVSETDYENIKSYASKGGMDISTYCREVLLKYEPDDYKGDQLRIITSVMKRLMMTVDELADEFRMDSEIKRGLRKIFSDTRRLNYATETILKDHILDSDKFQKYRDTVKRLLVMERDGQAELNV